jgi:hypothetical protein
MIDKKLALLGMAMTVIAGCSKAPSTDNAATSNSGAATTAVAADTTRVRGVLQSIEAGTLGIKTYDDQSVTVPIDKDTKVAWVVASNLASLKSGDFVGTATTGPDNALRAVELVIFPEAMRGSGEGHYGWDVPGVVAASGGGGNASSGMTNGTVQTQSAMTNGTVQPQSGMTNGTVTAGAGKSGETTLTIGYKGGTAKVLVPVGTPIVRFEPAERTVLARGKSCSWCRH